MNIFSDQAKTANNKNKNVNKVKNGISKHPNTQARSKKDRDIPKELTNMAAKMTELRFKVWNIFGLKQSKLNRIMNKTDRFLNNVFETADFVVLTETWSERGDLNSLIGTVSSMKLLE